MKQGLKFLAVVLCVVLCFSFVMPLLNTFERGESPEESRFSDLTMSCLGSSSTLPTKVDRAYPTVVKQLLGLKSVYNYGHGWSTMAYKEDCPCHDYAYDHAPFVFRYKSIKKADIIVVQGGGANDYGCSVPIGCIDDTDPTTFYGALNTIMKGLKKMYPDSYILFMTGFDIYGQNAKNSAGIYWYEYQRAIINACEKHGIDCLDIYHDMPMDRATDTVDGAHPTQEFIDNVWAPKIAAFIRSNYKR